MNSLRNSVFDKDFLIWALTNSDSSFLQELFAEAHRVRVESVGEQIYFRGLIEISNICRKNCLYCGIRKGNSMVSRYELSDEDILLAAQRAFDSGYGYVALQAGERDNAAYTARITRLVQQIKLLANPPLGITLSLGEQSLEVYREWHAAGGNRYLLRIETSSKKLYSKIHPNDNIHSFDNRLQALHNLRKAGFLVGTGVMIGLPFQTIEHLADDLLFMRDFGVDMCGMGPYLDHNETPFHSYRHTLYSEEKRFTMTLKMIALLRLMMPHINIVASTAMQVLDPLGREKALSSGANVVMPNITPAFAKENYKIYNGKTSAI